MLKKSFIIHIDSLDILSELTDEQAGQLLRAMVEYNKGEDIQLTGLMKALFVPFQNQFNRDLDNYIKQCEKNKENGAKGGRPQKPTKSQSVISETHKKPVGFSKTQPNPQKPDNDNDSDSDSDNDFIEKPIFSKSAALSKNKSFKFFSLEDFKKNITESRGAAPDLDNSDITQFIDYWTERSASGRMKFQLERTWETAKRLQTWQSRKNEYRGRAAPVQGFHNQKILKPNISQFE